MNEATPIRLWDTKEQAFISARTYKSRTTARRAAERRNQQYGAHRYSVVGGL